MAVIALDLGGTKIAGALFDNDGRQLHRQTQLLEGRAGSQVGALVVELSRSLHRQADQDGIHPEAMGICVPGISHAHRGTVWAPNIPGWEDYPLQEEMRSAFASTRMSITIDSDRACSILGELWQGAAKGARDAIFLAVGTGIGAGILADGKVLRGAHDIAGAIGWMALDRPFEQKYVACGCFEYYASGEGIARVAREMLDANTSYRGVLRTKAHAGITAHDVFEAYESHDRLSESTLSTCIEFWGMATANLVSLFNPEKIIFGGGVFGPAARFLDAITREARKWAQPISMSKVQLEVSMLGGDAPLYGAGLLALESRRRQA
ncbi:MAG: ROK family protein [Bacteroidota bacterium]